MFHYIQGSEAEHKTEHIEDAIEGKNNNKYNTYYINFEYNENNELQPTYTAKPTNPPIISAADEVIRSPTTAPIISPADEVTRVPTIAPTPTTQKRPYQDVPPMQYDGMSYIC